MQLIILYNSKKSSKFLWKKQRKFITVTISGKTAFSVFPANREPDFFLSLKPSGDQDEDNDIRYSPIGSAVFELLDDRQTNKQTNILSNILKQ